MNTSIFTLGVIVLILGILAYGLTVTDSGITFFANDDRPYQAIGIIGIIIGVILVIIGSAIPTVRTKEITHVEPERVRRKTVIREEEE